MKTCIKCKELKYYSNFQYAVTNKDKYNNVCNSCKSLERNDKLHNGVTKVCSICKVEKSIGSYYGRINKKRDHCITCANSKKNKKQESEFFEHDPYYKF